MLKEITANSDIFLQNRPVAAMNLLFVLKCLRGVLKMSVDFIHNDEAMAADAMLSSIVRQCGKWQIGRMVKKCG